MNVECGSSEVLRIWPVLICRLRVTVPAATAQRRAVGFLQTPKAELVPLSLYRTSASQGQPRLGLSAFIKINYCIST